MTMTVRTETWRGPFAIRYPDGRCVGMERKAIIVTDVRETVLGPIDFGHTRLLPWSQVELPRLEPAVAPKKRHWWRFW